MQMGSTYVDELMTNFILQESKTSPCNKSSITSIDNSSPRCFLSDTEWTWVIYENEKIFAKQ
jgi:hypothetical protein